MSHDDRIRQLTDLFIDDLRGPIESSLRQFLAGLSEMADREKAAAIETTLAHAAADRESALATAVDAAAQQREEALEALRAELTGSHEEALDALRADLTAKHEEELDALRAELNERHDQALQFASQEAMAEHDARLQALRDDLVRNREESLAALREQAEVEREGAVQAARAELVSEHELALASLREQLEREHQEAVVRHRESLDGDRDPAVSEARARAETAAAAALAALERERDAARSAVAELTDQLAAARARHEQLTTLADAESEAVAQMSAGAVEALAEERQSELACTERVLAAMRALDGARTLSDILTALADHTAAAAIRVGVLLVQGTRLRGWRFVGMGDVQANAIDLSLHRAGLLGRAVDSGLPASSASNGDVEADDLPPFLAVPAGRVGLALPIVVGGRVVAVLYADDAGSESPVVPSSWPEIAEVLARHAGRCLEVLTLSRAAGVAGRQAQEIRSSAARPAVQPPASAPVTETDEAREEESARRHARLLISEIKLYNEELVERGRREGNLLALLGSEIERARRLYEEKIPAAVRERVDCFDEEIVRTLAGGDATLLGQVT